MKSSLRTAAWKQGVYDSDEYRQKQSEIQSKIQSEIQNRPEVKQKKSGSMLAAHARGDFGEEWRHKLAESVGEAWDRGVYGDEWRQNMSASQLIAQNRPEVRQKKSKATTVFFQDPINREKQSKIMTAVWKVPGYRERQSEISRRVQNLPEVRKKNSESTSAAHARGAYDGMFTADVCRKISESKLGDKHPNWRGGISLEPYDSGFDKVRKGEIRKHYKNTCVVCENPGGCVHHIDYDKRNSGPENLILLCRSCHGRTNYGRSFWQSYFEGQVYLALGAC